MSEAVWAPSVHNTQPWRFTAGAQEISVYADAGRALTVTDPDSRELMISCGAALFNVRLALRSLGYVPQTAVRPDPAEPGLVARVSWRQRVPAGEFERRLAAQVRVRRTHRGAFDPEPLPQNLLAVLRGGAARDGAALRIVADDGRRAALAAAVQTAERVSRLDGDRVRELAAWAPPPASTRRDGVTAASYPVRAEHTDPYFPGRDFSHGHGWGLPPLSSAGEPRAAGLAALLTTDSDRPLDWVNAGQALQRILLTASSCGVAVALHSQPAEVPWLREYIRTQFAAGSYPHLVLRMGLVVQVAASVRRSLDKVLSSAGQQHRFW